jgi:hypothetical protein
MRFLANENFPGAAIEALRAAGNDVVWIRVNASGSSDPMPRPDSVGQQLTDLIMARDDWAGHFSVIEPGRIRMRLLGK